MLGSMQGISSIGRPLDDTSGVDGDLDPNAIENELNQKLDWSTAMMWDVPEYNASIQQRNMNELRKLFLGGWSPRAGSLPLSLPPWGANL